MKWIGFDEDQTWYYALNFVGSPHWLRIFHMDYPNHPGPLKRLEHWLQLWKNGEDSTEEHLDNDYTQDWGQPWFKEGGYVTALNLSKNLSTSWQWFYCLVIESVTWPLRLLADTSTDFKNQSQAKISTADVW